MIVGYLQKKNLLLIIHLIQSNILRTILIRAKVFEKQWESDLISLVLAIKNFRSYLWGKVILELFTIEHPHVELRYLLSLDQWHRNKTNQATGCTYEMFPGHFELNINDFIIFKIYCVPNININVKRID